MFQAIVDEHGITGYTQMKKALSCAVMAKNATLTKDGYTPNQRVFGVEHKWPSLTADDVGMSFVQGLSADSEVARAHKMRTTARVALIRQDVRDKLRRTLLRKPPTATGPFVSGAQIYFGCRSSSVTTVTVANGVVRLLCWFKSNRKDIL